MRSSHCRSLLFALHVHMCLVTQTNGFRLPTVTMALERPLHPAASVTSPRGVRVLVLEPGEPGYKRQRVKNFWGNLFRR